MRHTGLFFVALLLAPLTAGAQSAPASEEAEGPDVFVKSAFPDKWDEGTTVEIYGAGFLPPEAGKNRVCLVGHVRGPKEDWVAISAPGETRDDAGALCVQATYSAKNRVVFTLDEKFALAMTRAIAGS